MAIEPAGIIKALQSIDDTNLQATLDQIFFLLPSCIQRAMATLQCAQLEKEYKGIVLQFKKQYHFDLPQWMRDRTMQIIERRR
jgi:hypothetical protein